MKIRPLILCGLLVLGGLTAPVLSQTQEAEPATAALKQQAPKVYIDCHRCDQDYIRTEIPFVNYVRDPKEADVHVLITTQSTGSGGTEYTLAFIGQGAFAGVDNTLIYASRKIDTSDEVRRGYVAVLKMGLLPYAAKTPIRDLLSVSFLEKVNPTDVVDKWKFWVFSFSLGTDLDQESQQKSESFEFLMTANKITPAIKIRLGVEADFRYDKFEYEDGTISSQRESGAFRSLFAKSLGEHWSIGFSLYSDTSTYRNLRFRVSPAPVVEYDLFPYSQSTRRQLRFQYRLGYEHVRYRSETIYDKLKESLWGQSLSATLELEEPWGSLWASLEGSHYFQNFKYNRVEFDSELSFRIFKGLKLNVDAGYERIRDQLALQKGDLSLEEILLRRKELATDYNLSFSVSLSYTFGSIYSNVVNPRFGGLGSL
ncbi:MAG: hypothetical protein OEW05_09250 [Candidatus Aminicenantes bacterium]|nr:hypothetical protein [Candidatus Aminicenantes bacterium]